MARSRSPATMWTRTAATRPPSRGLKPANAPSLPSRDLMQCEYQGRQVCRSTVPVSSQAGPFSGCQSVRPPTAVPRSVEPLDVPVLGLDDEMDKE
jgi:hypothetical protein